MPSSQTITSFFTFTPNTKAKSSEVNTNFSNFRGHLFPIDPNTATAASTTTYDLGTTDHRWRGIYGGSLDLAGSTSTGNWSFVPSTSNTTGGMDLLLGSSTIASFSNTGLKRTSLKKMSGTTLSASYFEVAQCANVSYNATATATTASGSVIHIVGSGNPILLSIMPAGSSSFRVYNDTTSVVGLSISRNYDASANASIIMSQIYGCQSPTLSGFYYWGPMMFLDTSYTPDITTTYYLVTSARIDQCKFRAWEL